MKLINIGFGNMVSARKLVAIVSPESAPIKRIIQDARDRGSLIDATYGRRTRAVIITDSDHVILSAVQPRRWPTVWATTRTRMRKMSKRGQLVIYSGPSGVGQGDAARSAARHRAGTGALGVGDHPRSPQRGGGRSSLSLYLPGGI